MAKVSQDGLELLHRTSSPHKMPPATMIDNPRQARADDKIIAVMGPTGCGKSNIIDRLTKATQWASGSTVDSVTRDVRAVRIQLSGQNVVLVDTPGFNDTEMSDMDVLELIGEWLKTTYRNDIKLAGVLYLHRIMDNRMAGSAHRNLKLFGKICGDKPARKVIYVTTMWDKVMPRDIEIIERREKSLTTDFWTPMLVLGARTFRFLNTEESAKAIVSELLSSDSEAQALLLQEEMVDLNRDIIETQAAKTLYTDLQKTLSKHKEALADIQKAAKRANGNAEALANLKVEEDRLQMEQSKILEQVTKLKISLSRRVALFFSPKPATKSLDFPSGR